MSKERKNIFLWFVLALICAFCVTVWLMPNGDGAPWVPRCWWYAFTGTLCPGCGTTRALYALAHGRIADAWALNPFLFVGVPWGLACAWVWLRRPASRALRPMALAYAAMFVGWWVIRNFL